MKKNLMFLLMPAVLLASCKSEKNKDLKTKIDACINKIDGTQMQAYSDAYNAWVTTNPQTNTLNHIALDTKTLSYLCEDWSTIALIPVVINNTPTIVVERIKPGYTEYDDIGCLFGTIDPTTKSYVFCPPPPVCSLPIIIVDTKTHSSPAGDSTAH